RAPHDHPEPLRVSRGAAAHDSGRGQGRVMMKASPTTVGTMRAKLGSTVQPRQLAKRVGKNGKVRKLPAKKKDADSKVRKAAQRKRTKRQLEQQERDRRAREEADRVVAILIERLRRDGLVLDERAWRDSLPLLHTVP